MKSRPFIAMVGARAMRAKVGSEVRAIAAMMFEHGRAEHRHQHQPEYQRWKGEQHVHSLHRDRVETSAAPAGQHADRRARRHGDQGCAQADDERDARAIEQARKRIAAVIVGAEEMVGGRRLQAVENVLLQRVIWRKQRREKRRGDHQRHDRQSYP